MDHILKVENLTISLANKQESIVKDVSFDVCKGRVLGIIGESGSGKTLTCKAVMQLLNKRVFTVSGNIFFNGQELNNGSNLNRDIFGKDISLIMQNPMTAFDPMTRIGNQIIETVRTHTKMTKKQAYELGVEALEKMNLPRTAEIMHAYPHMLSGGMLQRVMIAIAVMLKPSIIFADEATTALDVNTQSIILDEFKRMRDEGIALVIVTHDFGVIAKIADDVVVMQNGTIVEHNSVHEIFKRPKSIYTKELLNARILVEEVSECSA